MEYRFNPKFALVVYIIEYLCNEMIFDNGRWTTKTALNDMLVKRWGDSEYL